MHARLGVLREVLLQVVCAHIMAAVVSVECSVDRVKVFCLGDTEEVSCLIVVGVKSYLWHM